MESTQSIYVELINETWELPDDLVLKLEDYKKDHPEKSGDADDLHMGWYQSLSEEEIAAYQL